MPKKRQKKRKKRPPQVEHKPFWAERGKSIKRYIRELGYLDDEPIKNPWEDNDDAPDFVMRHYARQIMPPNVYLDHVPIRMNRGRSNYPSFRETNLCNEISLGEFYQVARDPDENPGLTADVINEVMNTVEQRMMSHLDQWQESMYRSFIQNQTPIPHDCLVCSAYTGSPYLRCAIHPDLKENCESWEPKK